MRYRVLLVDPVRHRRERALDLLRAHYEVVGVSDAAEAREQLKGRKPDAVMLTLRQLEGNGLVLGKEMRARLGGDALILVHGDSNPPATSAERAQAAAAHGVSGWMPSTLEPPHIDALIGTALARRYQPAVDRERKSAWERLPANRSRVWEFLTRHRHIIPTPYRSPEEPPGWIEILNGPPTLANARLLWVKARG